MTASHRTAAVLPADPRSLDLAARHALRQRMEAAQRRWLPRLRELVEPPAPALDFPAFLLETPALAGLAARLGTATRRADLPTAVQDEVQRFVDAFADYLRSDAGEQVFDGDVRRVG